MGEPDLKRMTADEFLVWQQSQDRNYELVDGLPVLPLKAMTGATREHDTVTLNVLAALHSGLRGKPCRARTQDIAVKTPAGDVRRPDAMVECGVMDPKGVATTEPRLVVEVQSPSTTNYDRGRKVEEYKTVPALAYILVIDTETPRVTFHRREGLGWSTELFSRLDAVIDLPEIGCQLAARDIFEGLPFAE